jgi:hypothetical protein
MPWRTWRLSHHVQWPDQILKCSGQNRYFATKSFLRSKSSNAQSTHLKPAIRGVARTEISAPLYRAVQLFRGPEVPSRSRREDIKIGGIIRSIRRQKHASFAHISDGSTLAPIQAVLDPELGTGCVDLLEINYITALTTLRLTNGTFVEVTGRWQPSPAKGQSHELVASQVKIHGPSDPEVRKFATSW